MAKLADYLGRGETYIVVTLFYVVGYILYATTQTIGQIAAAQIVSFPSHSIPFFPAPITDS